MNYTARRHRLRTLLAGSHCHSPASVYDPLTARIAAEVGYQIGLLSGSMVAAVTIGAPDLMVHTISEFAEQIRRVTRASDLSLLTDADNGYGNALNVMRTVEEFEHAGVAGLSIEDTSGTLAFGQPAQEQRMVSVPEMTGKLRAALAARSDPALVIAARTVALQHAGLPAAVERAKAYAAAGVDALWTVTLDNLEQLRALHDACGLPIIVGSSHGTLSREALASCGGRIMLQGHLPLAAALKAVRGVYTHLHAGGTAAELQPQLESSAEMARLLGADTFTCHLHDFLK